MMGRPLQTYRVEYVTPAGQRGEVLLHTSVSRDNSLRVRARGLLADRGIQGQVQRIVAVQDDDPR
jgi:hypothetical protein